jgi:hypothetical protein
LPRYRTVFLHMKCLNKFEKTYALRLFRRRLSGGAAPAYHATFFFQEFVQTPAPYKKLASIMCSIPPPYLYICKGWNESENNEEIPASTGLRHGDCTNTRSFGHSRYVLVNLFFGSVVVDVWHRYDRVQRETRSRAQYVGSAIFTSVQKLLLILP